MTRIRLSPLEQTNLETRAAAATLTARASYPFYVDEDAVVVPTTSRWTFAPNRPAPVVELTEPIGYAWVLTLQVEDWRWRRTVVFIGEDLDWADLTDVDPATLAALPDRIDTPTGRTLITREETLARIAELDAEQSEGLDFTLLFENGLI